MLPKSQSQLPKPPKRYPSKNALSSNNQLKRPLSIYAARRVWRCRPVGSSIILVLPLARRLMPWTLLTSCTMPGSPVMLSRTGAGLHLFYCETLLIRMWDGGGSCSRR
jgi:hypothetical protein